MLNSRFVLWVAIIALAGGAFGCADLKKPKGDPANITVKTVGFDGVEAAIAAAKGKVVLIDCWATWCTPCVESFPKLVAKHEKYADRGLAVISLSLDEASATGDVLAFLKKQDAAFTNLQLNLGDAAVGKGMTETLGYKGGIPHAVLFDRKGKRVWAGHPMDDRLQRMIETELAK
jgi:thiol-disulfide isomerase/thioredoxin